MPSESIERQRKVFMFLKISKFLVITICFSLLACTTQSQAITEKYKYAKSSVKITSKPNRRGKVFTTLFQYRRILSLGKIGKWDIVEYKNKIAYVKSKCLTSKKPKYTIKSCPMSNSFKSYEDYTCITSTGSPQYKLQHNKAHTDKRTGIRMVDDRYCVALGSYYAKKIGTKFDMIMKSGKVIKCILADQKADSDTINNHRQHPDGSIAEFIVSTRNLPRIVRRMGDISYVKPFKGKIKKIKIYK